MRYAIALDIGGTKIEGALFNDKYKQLKKERIYFRKKKEAKTVTMSRKQVLDIIYSLIKKMKKGKRIHGIGISITDVVTKDGSLSGQCKVKALSNFPLAKHLSKKFRCRVKAGNDADCFALGEQRAGAGKGLKYAIGVIYGTGIGAGIILKGNIYSGPSGSAGEFGHNPISITGPKCRCGLSDVEAYASGPNLTRNYIDAGGKINEPDPKKIFASKENIAIKTVDMSLDGFARGLAQLQNILNPEIIILGGGMSNLNVYRKLNTLTKKYTKSGMKQNVRIVKNKLGENAGIYGAAALAFY